MDRHRAVYFSQEEQIIITEGYEEYKKIITAESNTVAANKAREDCWQKLANLVNPKLIYRLIYLFHHSYEDLNVWKIK